MKHNKVLTSTAISLILALFFVQGVAGVSVGTSFLDSIEVNGNSEPYVFSCGNRIILDDATEPGRISQGGEELVERVNHYLFEGEQIKWDVLTLDMDGVENIDKVYVTIGENQGEGNNLEVNCQPYATPPTISDSCNARLGEYHIAEYNPEIMKYYSCKFTVETPESMYGEYWVTVEARDLEGNLKIMDESEYWFFNPIISLSVNYQGELFENLEPGNVIYSKNISIKNAVDEGSGVWLDMFISGTDFTSQDNSSFCPEERKLSLDKFRFFAQNGIYDTKDLSDADNEGYRPIQYGIGFHDPTAFYNSYEVIPKDQTPYPYYVANILSPNEQLDLRLKLDIPEFCRGEFGGGLYIWAEAI